MERLKQLLKKHQEQSTIQLGLLQLAKLTNSISDISLFTQELSSLIRTYFPEDNLYFQFYAHPSDYDALNYYVDKHRFSGSRSHLNTDIINCLKSINKPVLLCQDHIWILETEHNITKRPFPNRKDLHVVGEDWLLSPIIIENTTIGIVGIKSLQTKNIKHIVALQMIDYISLMVSTAIQKLSVTEEQLKSFNNNVDNVVFTRTNELQKANNELKEQVEERRKVEEKLYFAAHHDTLTELPNRAMFTQRLEHSLLHLKRHPNHRFAVLFIDLDRFKIINDTLGHHIGDQLLIQISERIGECIRGNDILARLGGDEFVILLDTLAEHRDAQDIAIRIIESIEQPFLIENQEVNSSVSIGISICENNYHSAREILRDADAAMYQAKSLGRGQIVFFDDTMRAELLASLSLEKDLQIALKEQQFKLHFQSIIELDSNNIQGFETFLRWQHPEKGLLPPADFLCLAEDTGQIVEIEFWLISEVGKLLKQLPTEMTMSINLSGKHLSQKLYLDALLKAISTQIETPERLVIEFKEASFKANHDDVLSYLIKLQKLGVKLALGGYGSGLSSLSYIQNYPFIYIKFDQVFIRSLEYNDRNYALASSLCDFGETFNIKFVAEGIETVTQYNISSVIGCSFGQGYFIDKPKPLNQLNATGKNISCA